MENPSDTLERIKVREVAGVFHSRRGLENAVEDLLLNGFDRADIDRLASLDELRKRLKGYVAPEELADLPPAPREPVITWDDATETLITAASVIGAAAGMGVAFGILASGGSTWRAVLAGILVGLAAATAAGLLLARVFRRDDLPDIERAQFGRGVILWVRVRSPDREALAQEILRRNGGRAVRVHEIDIEKRADDLPLSSVSPDPWLGSEPLGRL